MPRGKDTSALASHLWNYHDRTRSTGTLIERTLFHDELHFKAESGELNHEHGSDGSFIVVCACGHSHNCTVLAVSKED
jgi:ABC-type nickel/cobalt efflux system permease component RcnA